MKHTPLQLAKREVHSFFSTRPAWIATLAAGVLLGVAGPFGTDEVMRLVPRMIYWSGLAVVSFLTGSIVDAVFRPILTAHVNIWIAIAITALISAILITAEILGLNGIVFGFIPDWTGLLILAGNVYFASLVISGTLNLIGQEAEAGAVAQGPALMTRLPLEKRGALISLSAVDHYVEVSTTAGTELLLMRLSDAIAETAPVTGLQLHRSHWAATAHIASVKKQSGKGDVILSDGRTLPVSRANLPALKAAGLLPA